MKWHFIDSGFNTGKFNMDFDIQLAKECKEDEAFFRLYRWKPFCISLGANQSFEDIDLTKAKNDGIDVVQRPTGGRAILHSDELTYSVILPVSSGYSSSEIYRKTSLGLVNGLRMYSKLLSGVELENSQPDFTNLLKTTSGAVCFASTAKSEVKFNGLKLIGSAQRKMNKSILQHGSILCGDFHLNLINYLRNESVHNNFTKVDFLKKTTNLSSILNSEIDYISLTEKIVCGFKQEWNIEKFHDY